MPKIVAMISWIIFNGLSTRFHRKLPCSLEAALAKVPGTSMLSIKP